MGRFVRNGKTTSRAAADAIRRRNAEEARQAEQEREDERQRELRRSTNPRKRRPVSTSETVVPELIEFALELLKELDYPNGSRAQFRGDWRTLWRKQTVTQWLIAQHKHTFAEYDCVNDHDVWYTTEKYYYLTSNGELTQFERTLRHDHFSNVPTAIVKSFSSRNAPRPTDVRQGLAEFIDDLERKAQRQQDERKKS